MVLKTIVNIFLLFVVVNTTLTSCGSAKPGQTYATVEETEKARAKEKNEKLKLQKKAEKDAHKNYWKKQSKMANRLVKQTKRNKKRVAKGKKPRPIKHK